ncbi:MAG: alpha/beta fold hydrolase [Isosphaeraceae bacterium]|nr:alpha/beta fold hydrolase [Isosphaeraceae bacterium]
MNQHIFALILLFAAGTPATAQVPPELLAPSAVKGAFLKLLDRPRVPLDVQLDAPQRNEDGLVVERLSFASEKRADGSVERVPVLVVRPEKAEEKQPAVLALHGTGGSKDGMRSWLNELARHGFLAVAIDARYQGARSGGAKGAEAYVAAITRAWRTPDGQPREHPFYYDTCWDIWRTLDYLESRGDVDPKRIGVIGVSMGGIETWLAAAVDERIAVAVPAIGVQSFRWSLENGQWQGRARTIKAAHDAAAKDLGEPEVNAKVCRALWDKVIPGMLGPFDCPSMLRLFAGRPLLILNGELDPNCPLGGAEQAFAAAKAAFEEAGAADKLKINVAEGVGHSVTDGQRREAVQWFERWLKP